MALTKKQAQYQSHLNAAESAGLPLAAYAKQHGLSVQSLYAERYRLRQYDEQAKPGAGFVQVRSEQTMPPTLLQIRLPNGVSLAVPTREIALTDMLQTLARL